MRKFKYPIIEDTKKVEAILQTGCLSSFRGTPEGHLGGKYVRKLEDAFCDYFNVKYAVAMNSATACLHASMIACGVYESDRVVVSPYTFASSATCVKMVNGIPLFADIQDDTFCIDSLSAQRLCASTDAKAIIPVHLMGHPADMDSVMDVASLNKLKVIEDCAQAIGAKYKGRLVGTIGDCGIFSFNQSKHISTGEGGILITNDDKIARIVRAVRNHGEVSDPELGIIGYNYRLCEIEASLALDQFKKLDRMNAYRIQLAGYLSDKLSKIEGLTPPVTYPDCKHVFYTYAVKFDEAVIGIPRDVFQDKLMERGVYFGKGYVKPLYLLPVFGGKEGQCPVTERMWRKELMVTDVVRYPATLRDMDRMVKAIKGVIQSA